jgi:hypothetical protein
MAGTGIEVRLDEGEQKKIIDALARASNPDLRRIAHFAGLALMNITDEAFKGQESPAGEKWAALKYPRGSGAKKPGFHKPYPAGPGDATELDYIQRL